MGLLLLAIDPKTGRTTFGPKLAYALAVAELIDLVQAGRIGLRESQLAVSSSEPTGEPQADSALRALAEHDEPLTVAAWVQWRGPWRINPYLQDAVDARTVRIVTVGSSDRKLVEVTDAEQINAVTRRLIGVLDNPEPTDSDVAFAVLADTADVAGPHLHGWAQHKHRSRLSALGHAPAGEIGSVLRSGVKAAKREAKAASLDPGSIDKQIGLTQAGRNAAWLLNNPGMM